MKIDNSIFLIGRIRENVNNFIVKELEELGIKGVVPSHGDILVSLFKQEEMTMTEIANKIHRDRSTVTTLVNKLMKLGYIKSKKNPEDSRSSIIYLTTKGKALEKDFKEISDKIFQKEYKGIDESEKEIFYRVLNKIHENFER